MSWQSCHAHVSHGLENFCTSVCRPCSCLLNTRGLQHLWSIFSHQICCLHCKNLCTSTFGSVVTFFFYFPLFSRQTLSLALQENPIHQDLQVCFVPKLLPAADHTNTMTSPSTNQTDMHRWNPFCNEFAEHPCPRTAVNDYVNSRWTQLTRVWKQKRRQSPRQPCALWHIVFN